MGKAIGSLASAVCASASLAHAVELITIEKLQRNPEFYDNQTVTLHGSVHQIQFIAPSDSGAPFSKAPDRSLLESLPCSILRPAYTFILADDTGFLQVAVFPLAGEHYAGCAAARGLAPPPDVGEGEEIIVDVRIKVAHHFLGVSHRTTLEAYAVSVRRPHM